MVHLRIVHFNVASMMVVLTAVVIHISCGEYWGV